MDTKRTREAEALVYEGVSIMDAGSEGKAVGKIDGQVVFVPYAMPGDVVDIQIVKRRKGYLEGKILRFQSRPEEVQEAPCQHFGICGGCKWQHMPYHLQVFYKQKQVMDNLARIGKVVPGEIRSLKAAPYPYYYRNKLEFSFSNKKWLVDPPALDEVLANRDGLGFHLPGLFDRIIDIEACLLQPDPSNAIRLAIRDYAVNNGLSFWDARTHQGFLRNLILRNNLAGEWMVIVVFHEDKKALITPLLSFILDRFPDLVSLMYVINPKRNDDISDLKVRTYHGPDHLIEEMDGLKFRIGPKSFFQTNTLQARFLYEVTREFAGLQGNEMVYDLYTGTGTIALYLARHARQVLGIEYVEAAVEDARINAVMNGIDNVSFVQGDMAKIFNQELMDYYGRPDVIVLDPPRAGVAPKVIERLREIKAARIVYVSCNPATQARDLALLSDIYTLNVIQPVDMFPQTHHVENVALLELIV